MDYLDHTSQGLTIPCAAAACAAGSNRVQRQIYANLTSCPNEEHYMKCSDRTLLKIGLILRLYVSQ